MSPNTVRTGCSRAGIMTVQTLLTPWCLLEHQWTASLLLNLWIGSLSLRWLSRDARFFTCRKTVFVPSPSAGRKQTCVKIISNYSSKNVRKIDLQSQVLQSQEITVLEFPDCSHIIFPAGFTVLMLRAEIIPLAFSPSSPNYLEESSFKDSHFLETFQGPQQSCSYIFYSY